MMWTIAAAFLGGMLGGATASIFQEWWRNRSYRKRGEALVKVVSMADF